VYIVKVQVLGAAYEIPVKTEAEARRLIRVIEKNGYRYHVGNAVIDYPPMQIKSVNYRKE